MADVGVKQQDSHEDQEVDERTDTKAEERDDGRQTKTEEKEESPATQQKEEEQPPATQQKEEPPVTKQREDPPATKQKEERPVTKQREDPPATRDGDRGGDMRDNQSASSASVSAYNIGTPAIGANKKSKNIKSKSSVQKDTLQNGRVRGKNSLKDSESVSNLSLSSQFSSKQLQNKIFNVAENASLDKIGAVKSDKSKASDASRIFAALGVDACVNDFSPDPITPDQDVGGSACAENIVEEDSFYDGDVRGEELEDGGVAIADFNTPDNSHTIDFFTQPAKISSDNNSHKLVQEPPLATSLQVTSNKEIFHRPLTNESEADVIRNSTITMASVQEELETKSNEADEETRGDLAIESPRTIELEDDNRAIEKFGETVKTMVHPGTTSREIGKNSLLARENQTYKFTSDILNSSNEQNKGAAHTNFRNFRGDEVKRKSQHPHFSHRDSDSRDSEIPERIEGADDDITPEGREPNNNNRNFQDDIYSCESFEALSVLDKSVTDKSDVSPFDRSVSQLSLNQQDSPALKDNDDKDPGNQIVAVLASRKLKAEQAKGDGDSESFFCDNKGQNDSDDGKVILPSGQNREEETDDLCQTLNFDFQQAQMDFDLHVDVKAEAILKGKTSPTGNSEVASNSSKSYNNNKKPLGTKSSVTMGNRHKKVKSPSGPTHTYARQNLRGRTTPEIKKEVVRKKIPPPDKNPPIEMPKFTEFFPREPEEGIRNNEVAPKVVPFAPRHEVKALESTGNAKSDTTFHDFNNSGDKDTTYENNRENNDDESTVDDFDEFDSRHLAKFRRQQHATEKMLESSHQKAIDSVPQRRLSRHAEEGRSLSPTDTNQSQEGNALKGQGRRTLHASRPLSRSATELTSTVDESGGLRGRPRPNTTQTMARRGGSEMTKGQTQKQSEETNNSQEDNTTKDTQKTHKGGKSPSRREDDNHNQNQKNTKSVSKGDSTKETTKTSPKSQKTTQKKDTAKKDTKGSPDRKQGEGVKGSESRKRGNKGENAEQEKKGSNEADENSGTGNDTSRSSNLELSEGRTKQREFFKLELERLEGSLKRESSKIVAPTKKPHTPYIFNTLEPYYNTQITRYLIELPDEMKHGHTSRRTAQGLTDPWVDLRMDRDILPKVPSKPVSRQVAILKREKEIRDRKKRSAVSQSSSSRKGGSTRLPKFPVVSLETQDLASKPLFYSDVPFLRSELKSKYSSSARSKIDQDYKRTQQDFFRMELDKLDEVHPVNRRHMRSAYFAYLQNTPGSKKAITDCVRGLESGKAQ